MTDTIKIWESSSIRLTAIDEVYLLWARYKAFKPDIANSYKVTDERGRSEKQLTKALETALLKSAKEDLDSEELPRAQLSIRKICKLLAEEHFRRDRDMILLTDPQSGKAVAQVPKDSVSQSEDGTLVLSEKVLAEIALVHGEIAKEEAAVERFGDHQVMLASATGRRELTQRILPYVKTLLEKNDFPLFKASNVQRTELYVDPIFVTTSQKLVDLLSLNTKFDPLVQTSLVLVNQIQLTIAKMLAQSVTEIIPTEPSLYPALLSLGYIRPGFQSDYKVRLDGLGKEILFFSPPTITLDVQSGEIFSQMDPNTRTWDVGLSLRCTVSLPNDMDITVHQAPLESIEGEVL